MGAILRAHPARGESTFNATLIERLHNKYLIWSNISISTAVILQRNENDDIDNNAETNSTKVKTIRNSDSKNLFVLLLQMILVHTFQS